MDRSAAADSLPGVCVFLDQDSGCARGRNPSFSGLSVRRFYSGVCVPPLVPAPCRRTENHLVLHDLSSFLLPSFSFPLPPLLSSVNYFDGVHLPSALSAIQDSSARLSPPGLFHPTPSTFSARFIDARLQFHPVASPLFPYCISGSSPSPLTPHIVLRSLRCLSPSSNVCSIFLAVS